MDTQELQTNKIKEPDGVVALGWFMPFLFVIVEAIFLINAWQIVSRHSFVNHLMALVAFQLALINAAVCSWRLWRKNVIHTYRKQCWDHSRLYLSVLVLSALIMITVQPEITAAVYLLKHATQ